MAAGLSHESLALRSLVIRGDAVVTLLDGIPLTPDEAEHVKIAAANTPSGHRSDWPELTAWSNARC